MTAYRIDYRNGQVSDTMTNRREAIMVLAEAQRDCPTARLEWFDAGTADAPGDWFPVRRDMR